MLTNNLKENIFQKIEVKNNLIDPRANLYDFLNKFDYFLDKNDVMIGNLLTSKKLLQDNIIFVNVHNSEKGKEAYIISNETELNVTYGQTGFKQNVI